MTEGYQLMIHFSANTLRTYHTMNREGKVECSRADGQHFQVTFGCIDINFLCEKGGFEVVQKIDRIAILVIEDFADLLKPFIEAAFIGSTFLIFPVSGEAFFCD